MKDLEERAIRLIKLAQAADDDRHPSAGGSEKAYVRLQDNKYLLADEAGEIDQVLRKLLNLMKG